MPDKLAKVHAHITTSQLIFAAVLLGMATPFLLLSGAQATPLNTDSLSVKKSTLAQASKKDTNSSVRQLKGSVNADTFSTNSTPPNLTKSSKADTKAVETWFEK